MKFKSIKHIFSIKHFVTRPKGQTLKELIMSKFFAALVAGLMAMFLVACGGGGGGGSSTPTSGGNTGGGGTAVTAPATPTGVSASGTAPTATVSWSSVATATSYTVSRDGTPVQTVTTTSTTATVAGSYAVSACVDTSNCSNMSTAVSVGGVPTYTVKATVTGLTSGQSVTLKETATGQTYTATANGQVIVANVPQGQSYTVTVNSVSGTGLSCTSASNTGNSMNPFDTQVTCATQVVSGCVRIDAYTNGPRTLGVGGNTFAGWGRYQFRKHDTNDCTGTATALPVLTKLVLSHADCDGTTYCRPAGANGSVAGVMDLDLSGTMPGANPQNFSLQSYDAPSPEIGNDKALYDAANKKLTFFGINYQLLQASYTNQAIVGYLQTNVTIFNKGSSAFGPAQLGMKVLEVRFSDPDLLVQVCGEPVNGAAAVCSTPKRQDQQ